LAEIQIDKSKSWDFLMGLLKTTISLGGVPFYSSLRLIFLKCQWGLEVEQTILLNLLSFKLVLLFLGKGGERLIGFGDSMIVLNWARKSQQCHNLQLLSLLEEVHRIMETYDEGICISICISEDFLGPMRHPHWTC
jgi:hypothetical protein